jgi:hypothetical protein
MRRICDYAARVHICSCSRQIFRNLDIIVSRAHCACTYAWNVQHAHAYTRRHTQLTQHNILTGSSALFHILTMMQK